jgi:hypothetical protein
MGFDRCGDVFITRADVNLDEPSKVIGCALLLLRDLGKRNLSECKRILKIDPG